MAACSHSNIVTRGGQKQEMRLMGMMLALQPQCFIVTCRRWLHMVQLRKRLWSTSVQRSPGRFAIKTIICPKSYFVAFALPQTDKPSNHFAKHQDVICVLSLLLPRPIRLWFVSSGRVSRGCGGYKNTCAKHITVSMTGHMLTVCQEPRMSVSTSVNGAWLLTCFIIGLRSPPKKRAGLKRHLSWFAVSATCNR